MPRGQGRLRQALVAVGGVVEACPLAGPALEADKTEHEQHQDGGQLGCRHGVVHAEPGAVDSGGEGADPEVLDRAEVGQGLHQRQGHAGDDGRPRQRHGDGEKTAPRSAAEAAAGLQHTDRLVEECCPRQQVDVGIEHQGEHRDGAPDGTDFREPVVTVAQVEGGADPVLERAADIQHPGIGVGDDISRNGQRQQQRPA